ncbi:hypothetical protein [Aeromonas hydrophila]|uniref:hypothetical protein n=1 Tax=Aeromonas hydrophila TaxID=644 RepID=UPI003EC7920D
MKSINIPVKALVKLIRRLRLCIKINRRGDRISVKLSEIQSEQLSAAKIAMKMRKGKFVSDDDKQLVPDFYFQ